MSKISKQTFFGNKNYLKFLVNTSLEKKISFNSKFNIILAHFAELGDSNQKVHLNDSPIPQI